MRTFVRLACLAGVIAAGWMSGCGSDTSGVVFSTGAYRFDTRVLNTTTTLTGNRTVVTVYNATASPLAVSATLGGAKEFSLVSGSSCAAKIRAGATCAFVVNFAPTAAGSFAGTLQIQTGENAGAGTQVSHQVALAGDAKVLGQGDSLVSATDNPQVALYTWYPPAAGAVRVQFGPTGTYGRVTGTVAATGTAPVSLYVAGMLQGTQYHLQAQEVTATGTLTDTDHSFTTTKWLPASLPSVTVQTTGTPSPGVELVNVADANANEDLPLYVTDLAGNLLWAYPLRDKEPAVTIVQGARMLPNGDFILQESPASQDALTDSGFAVNLVREVDLAGNTVRQVSVADLNAQLTALGYTNMTLQTVHHETQVLPNGHLIVLANILRNVASVEGYTGAQNVLGDVVLDLDTNMKIAWVWNTFDHLDVNRHPAAFPDWTHCNAVIYSKDDGDLVLSCRHQSWLMKLNYANGTGDGSIVWKLGNGGDFALENGSAPIDWFYAEHYPSYVGTATAGQFQLTMVDNGDYRTDATGTQVCAQLTGANCYTTIPILTVNEVAKTATIDWRYKLPAANYSFWGGQAQQVANGDIEFDLSNQPNSTSAMFEVTHDAAQTLVWKMTVNGQNAYRGGRMTGLYPGVAW